MIFSLKCRSLDLGFVTALLLIAAIPLIFLRGHALLNQPEILAGITAILAGTVAFWVILSRRSSTDAVSTAAVSQSQGVGDGSLAWWQTALIAGLLAAVVGVNFFVPLRLHFWGGTDDFSHFPEKPLLSLMADWDQVINRPLNVLPAFAGQAITPDRIEGYLWVAAGLYWFNALLLYGILRMFLPQMQLLPIVAAVLYLIDGSEPSRFFVMWTSNYYWTPLALLLGGLWLFLWSYRTGSRSLLFLSCLLLVGALLTNESAFPLALVGPLLAWFLKNHRQRLPLWTYAWVGSIALIASRLLLFLASRGAEAYQTSQMAEAFQNPRWLWKSFRLHLEASLSNFQTSGAMAHHWKTAVLSLALVVVLVCLAAWRGAAGIGAPCRRQYLWVAGVAALAFLLGSVPFLHIRDVFRTQFLAAPGQAVLLACVLCPAACLLGRRAGVAVVAAVLGLLAANTTAEALASQRQLRAHSPNNFDRTVHIFRQIRAVYPNPMPDSLILLYLDEPTFAPFVCNYCCLHLSRQVLGTPMIQVNYADPNSVVPLFHPHSVTVQKGEPFRCPGEKYYDKVLAFRLALDGTVTLMRQLPVKLLPPDNTANRYNPLAHLRPGPVKEVPFLRYPFWTHWPTDLFDMTDGVLLGQGWGPLELWEAKPSRQADNGAELVVNPLGQQQRRLCFRIPGVSSGRLEALDLEDRVVAIADLDGSREVSLTVPMDPSRVHLLRLKITNGTGTVDSFRVFCPGAKLADFQQPLRPPSDIVTGGLALGRNWHPLETHAGQTFRWVTNDAEINLEDLPATPGELHLDLEPGFGLAGQPCRLTIRDQMGKTVATACVPGREVVRLKLPATTRGGTVLRMHVEGGGHLIATDPRVLNFRVFRCTWNTD